MKKLKITRDEIITLIEEKYNIKEIKFMRTNSYEVDSEVFDNFEYIEGELKWKLKNLYTF